MDAPNFSGPEYDHKRDHKRLTRQHEKIAAYMLNSTHWRSIPLIARETGCPENSVQAQLRHLRKPRFGCYIVDKKLSASGNGLYVYRVRKRTKDDPPYQGGQSIKALERRVAKLEGLLTWAIEHLELGDVADRAIAEDLRKEWSDV